jgi:hypothetical protein
VSALSCSQVVRSHNLFENSPGNFKNSFLRSDEFGEDQWKLVLPHLSLALTLSFLIDMRWIEQGIKEAIYIRALQPAVINFKIANC